MRVFGLSDLHVGHAANRETFEQLPAHPGDVLLVAGDVGETVAHLGWVLDQVLPKYARVVWVPGNHELWTTGDPPLRGEAKYAALVAECQRRGVFTPEDAYAALPGTNIAIAPLFLLYDYTFGPDGYGPAEAVRWAAESGILCADEQRLSPDPYPSREAWCHVRLADAERRLEARLAELGPDGRLILVNHWPLRRDLCRLWRIPRFVPWCGTRRTEDWHVRFRAEVVVSGHLHMRATDWRDGVRFEEISLGYPRQYDAARGAGGYLRQVWPAPVLPPTTGTGGPIWHR